MHRFHGKAIRTLGILIIPPIALPMLHLRPVRRVSNTALSSNATIWFRGADDAVAIRYLSRIGQFETFGRKSAPQ